MFPIIGAKPHQGGSDEDPAEPHMIPEEAIIRSLNQLRADSFYLIVYIRAKTDQETNEEHKVSDILSLRDQFLYFNILTLILQEALKRTQA